MAEQPTYKFLPEDQCLSQVQLFDYIDGKLTAAEMHAAEKHILSCGFCSDALEGLEKVKDRDKVAAFIPFAKKEDEEEKPKVIPLNPNRKYYALVAAVVLLVAVSFLMKLAFNNEPDSAKMADLTSKDSFSAEPRKENQPGFRMADSVSTRTEASGKNDLASTDQQNKNAGPADNRKLVAPPAFHNAFPTPVVAEEKPAPKSGDANADGEDRDDFANIVDAEAAPDKEKDQADHYEIADKSLAKQEQSRAADYKKKSKAETKSADDAKAPALDETQQDVVVNVPPQTTISQTPASTNGASPTQATGGTTSTYTWTPTATGSSTTISSPAPNTTVTVADSVSAGTMVSETETQINLSYENGVKMLQAGQAAASLDMFDKVLKDPDNAHYSDAKWQKAEALIQLKRTSEAKALLNELAAKPGKYQQKAKDKLKTL